MSPDYSTRIISQGGATTGTGGLNMYASTIGLVATNGVGIGTTVPSAALDVYYNGGASGTTQANITNFAGGSTTTNSSALNLRIQGAGGGMVDNYISAQYNSSGVGTYSIALKPGGTTTMTVLGSGNVGIGVAAPESLLTLYSSNIGAIVPTLTGQWKAQHAIYATSQYCLKLGAHYTAGVGAYSSIQSTEYYSGTEHPGYMVLQPIGGNVGIGTTVPSTALHVNSATAFSGIQLTNTYNGSTGSLGFYIVPSAGGNFINNSTGNAAVILPFDGKDLYIGRTTANNTSLVVQGGTGNVGIGLTAPGDRLHVAGGVKATNGFYSYNTSFSYYGGNATWSPGDPTNWPFGGNVFLVTFRGPSGNAGNAVRAAFIVFHSRWGAGNNNYGQITPLSNSYVSSWTITDGGISFTFNSSQAQEVAINFLVLN